MQLAPSSDLHDQPSQITISRIKIFTKKLVFAELQIKQKQLYNLHFDERERESCWTAWLIQSPVLGCVIPRLS